VPNPLAENIKKIKFIWVKTKKNYEKVLTKSILGIIITKENQVVDKEN
jgi:hypothetical protein